jgi:7,8-dihydropterin-6-yl-methyl-4-(beta-D-ribofuranosyl)aminobenzene 5'-phosphate synthase
LKTTCTVLCENTAGFPFKVMGEHGLSILIERGEQNTLFDTGQGVGLVSNAACMGKDLASVDSVVLSHGHYDHTGGLRDFLEAGGPATVFAHPDALEPKFAQMGPDTPPLSVGMPFSREELEGKGARFDLSPLFREVAPDIFATGEVPRPADWVSWDPRLMVGDGKGGILPDPFLDDLSLLLETEKGPVLLLGCAHAGLHAIVNHIRKESGHDRFHAILGGTHLGVTGQDEWEKAVDLLESLQVEKLAPGHCTGIPAWSFLASRLGDRVVPLSAGSVFEF